MRRTVLQALLTLTGIAALAIATSCYSEQSDEFQKLESSTSTTVKILEVLTTDANGAVELFGDDKVAQQFSISQSLQIQGARIKLRKTGDFTGDPNAKVFIQIWTNATDSPGSWDGTSSQQVLVTSLPISDPTDESEYTPFEFNVKPTLPIGTYWIVLQYVQNGETGDVANEVAYYRNTSLTDSVKNNIGSGWSALEDGPMGIIIYGKTVN